MRTQSCGVGVGVGLGVGVGVTVGDTVGVPVSGGVELTGGVELGLADGVSLGDMLVESDAFGVADVLLVAVSLADADAVPNRGELLDVAAVPEPEALGDLDVMEADVLATRGISTTFLGADVQTVVAEVVAAAVVPPAGAMAMSTPRAWPNMPDPRKANTVSAPSAAGLTISALTRGTSLLSASWQDRPCRPYRTTILVVGLNALGAAQ